MENWEQLLIERGYKNLNDAQKKQVKTLLAQAWREELRKRCLEAQPWDTESLRCLADLAPSRQLSAGEKLYYRAPGGGNIYKPVGQDGLPPAPPKKEVDPEELEAYHSMLERRAKDMLQYGKGVSNATLAKPEGKSMSFKNG